MKRHTYKADEIQLAAFGIARPEQGTLLEAGEPTTSAPELQGPRCNTCGAELEAGDQCHKCRTLGAEALTLETEE